MANCYLQVEGLSKSYGDRLLFGDISFGIDQGQKVGLVARNGAGKSTFLNILTGKESPDSGSVIWRNDVHVGYLEQLPPLQSEMNAVEYAAPPCPEGLDPSEWNGEDRARQLLGQFGIDDMNLPVCKLSGGRAYQPSGYRDCGMAGELSAAPPSDAAARDARPLDPRQCLRPYHRAGGGDSLQL